MNEPLPGQKTNIVAVLFTVAQALGAVGVIPAPVVEAVAQVAGGLFTITLALKAWRKARGGK